MLNTSPANFLGTEAGTQNRVEKHYRTKSLWGMDTAVLIRYIRVSKFAVGRQLLGTEESRATSYAQKRELQKTRDEFVSRMDTAVLIRYRRAVTLEAKESRRLLFCTSSAEVAEWTQRS